MVIIVIGLGSMGKRRIRLIKASFPNYKIAGVDTSVERQEEAKRTFGINVYSNIEEAKNVEKPSAAFVCTSPITHSKIIPECLRNDLHVFTELNLVSDGYEEMQRLASEKDRVLFISSTLLYRNDINYICDRVKGNKVNYIYHVGQYLPDWHPWENYKNFFVGNKKTNGCREIFAIDLPWIIRAFGDIETFNVIKDKSSSLEIDYDDNYIVTFKHKNGNKGVVCVDVISRKAIRNLEVFSENIHLFWEGSPNSLFEYDLEKKQRLTIETYKSVEKDKNYSDNIIENAYMDEIYTFFDMIDKNKKPRYTLQDDINTLRLIDEIEGV